MNYKRNVGVSMVLQLTYSIMKISYFCATDKVSGILKPFTGWTETLSLSPKGREEARHAAS